MVEFRDVYLAGKRYSIDEFGNIKSWIKTKTGFRKPFPNHRGYLMVGVKSEEGVTKNYTVHRLVYTAWIGAIPDGMTVDHIDGDKLNNHHSNLQLLTAIENHEKSVARFWKFISPSGDVVDIYNLSKFCKEEGLSRAAMCLVNKEHPKQSHHKGWRKYKGM